MMKLKSIRVYKKPRELLNMKEIVINTCVNCYIDKLEDSLKCYQEAIKLFKSQVDKAPLDKQGVFQIFLKNYEEKGESLLQKIQEHAQNSGQNQIDMDEQFVVINENLYEKDFQDLDLKYDPA